MARLALKFGYDGSLFYGYQRQPNVRTVEGEIIEACIRMHAFKDAASADFASASRTDRGVHAVGNVVAFNTEFVPRELIEGLNATCMDVLFHSFLEVNSSFNPRRARMRHYRYLLYGSRDADGVVRALKLFVGPRDFKNFSKSGASGRYRSIDRIETAVEDELLVIDFYGKSFLHNMIRRVVAASVAVAEGPATEEDIIRAFSSPSPRSFGLAPPQYLALMDIDYGMSFSRVAMKGETEARWRSRLSTLRSLEFLHKKLIDAAGM